jgi:hypothetical protein
MVTSETNDTTAKGQVSPRVRPELPRPQRQFGQASDGAVAASAIWPYQLLSDQ